MKILVIISSILIAQTSASFFDAFQGAVLSVQNSFGKMISDVVSDVKETVDCTILAVEHALALSEDAAIRYYKKCGNTINNTVTVTETRHIESSPQTGVPMQFPSEDYLKKEIPAVIDAKINETLTKILGSYNPSEKLRDVEKVLAKETKQLANVGNLVKQELIKVSNEVTTDLKNITNSHANPSVDSIMQEIKLLENKEQNSKNNSQASEIHKVIDDVLVKLDTIESTEATENVKLEHILKDLEFNSNSSFIDLRQQLETWKEEESRHLDDIQTKILEHERNSHPHVHNHSLNLPSVQYDSDIRETNIKEVNIISTKRISNASRETSSIDTNVNARNEQSHTLTLTKPKTNNNGHGNLSGVSSTSTSLKISQTTPNVTKDSDLKITVIRSKSYSLSKSVSISGKVHQVESTTNSNNKSPVHLTTDQPSTTTRLSNLDDNKILSIIITTTENTPVSESNISSTDIPYEDENLKTLSPEQLTSTSSIPSDIMAINVSDSTTEYTKATAIENTTNILNDSINTTTSSDLVTEQSSTTQGIPSTTNEEINNTPTDQPTTTETVTTTVPDTTTQRLTESENNPINSVTTNRKEEYTTTEADEATPSYSVSDHSVDNTVRIATSDKPIETSTVTESGPDCTTTLSGDELKSLQTDLPTTTANGSDPDNLQTTTNYENLSEMSTEQSTKSYEEVPTTSVSDDIKTTTTPDLITVNPSEISTEQSTALEVEESTSSLNILNSEYTTNTITTVIPDLTTEVLSSTTALSTKSNDEENAFTLKSVTTINPVSITEETSEMNTIITELTSSVGAEITTVKTVTTIIPEFITEYDTEQMTTSHEEEITTSVNTVETTTNPYNLSAKGLEISTAQITATEKAITSSEIAIETVTTTEPDLVTQAIEEIITEQSSTYKEEPTTNVNIITTTETDLITDSPTERHIEQSTTPYEEEVPTTVSSVETVTTIESDNITENPSTTIIEQNTTSYAEEITTKVPLHIVDPATTTEPGFITEKYSKINTEQSNNLKKDEITEEVNEVNALVNKYSNDVVTTIAPSTVTEHHTDHVQIRTTTVDEGLEDLTTIKIPTTANILIDLSDAPTVTASDTVSESTTETRNIRTNVFESESSIVTSDMNEPTTPSVYDFVTASTQLTTFDSPLENMDSDSQRTSTQRSKRTRKRNTARPSRRRNSTLTVTEISTTIPTNTNIEYKTVATAKIPIAIKRLPVFRSAMTAGPPTIADHIHSNKSMPLVNTYVPRYKERSKMPLRHNNPPPVLNGARQNVNKHEIDSSRHSIASSKPLSFPKNDLTANHEISKQKPKPQERTSRHFDEAPKPSEQRRFNRATPHTTTDTAFKSTTPRQQRSTKRNRTRHLDQVTDSPKSIRESTPNSNAPPNRKRADSNTRKTNRLSNEITENAYISRATTSKPDQVKNSYDMSPADYDAFFNIPPKNSAAHLDAVSKAHEVISNGKRSARIMNSILKNNKRNARSIFDILR